MNARGLHRLCALMLLGFIAAHLANHLAGLAGIETHLAWMRDLREVYRMPAVEALLLVAVAVQVGSGLRFAIGGWKQRRGRVAWLQAGSGLYLAFFLINHVAAVWVGRGVLGLDTTFHFAAAGFHVPGGAWFFAPYYALAVLALFCHLGCALYWRLHAQSASVRALALALPTAAGATLGMVIVAMLAGAFYPVQVPGEYLAPFDVLRP